ncbi:phage regulatory protein/antirepressor Ant [Halopseudomonas bauzanensis]|uniref:phage regulatory protein/antirepressor Ant n=1 Tax=Halopseudomonas bauzanensis TaxID=653930 RepID=UPI0025541D61|nr:phage regulatory protein/antirepressor Ant [Halopseudomonas bauzanensis]
MNRDLIMSNPGQLTMSSREIAELTDKQHKHVKRDIETMLRELGKDAPSFGRIYFDSMNRQQTEYHLDRELTEVLITGYSIPLRARVIRRLHELESRPHVTVPQSLPEALRLAADLAEQNSTLRLVVQEQAPKVEALQRIAQARGTLCLTDAAKHLGVQRKVLLAWMRENRWIYRREGAAHWLGYQPRLQAGLLEHRVTVLGTEDDGAQRLASQVRVTPKGLTVLAQKVGGIN